MGLKAEIGHESSVFPVLVKAAKAVCSSGLGKCKKAVFKSLLFCVKKALWGGVTALLCQKLALKPSPLASIRQFV